MQAHARRDCFSRRLLRNDAYFSDIHPFIQPKIVRSCGRAVVRSKYGNEYICSDIHPFIHSSIQKWRGLETGTHSRGDCFSRRLLRNDAYFSDIHPFIQPKIVRSCGGADVRSKYGNEYICSDIHPFIHSSIQKWCGLETGTHSRGDCFSRRLLRNDAYFSDIHPFIQSKMVRSCGRAVVRTKLGREYILFSDNHPLLKNPSPVAECSKECIEDIRAGSAKNPYTSQCPDVGTRTEGLLQSKTPSQ